VVQPDTVALRPDLRQEETVKTLVPSSPCRRNNSIVPVAGAAQRSPHALTPLRQRTIVNENAQDENSTYASGSLPGMEQKET